MSVVPPFDPQKASDVGGPTLEVFAETPRLNRWLFSKLAPNVHGDVLEIGSGIGNLSGLIAESATRMVFSDIEPHYLAALSKRFAGDSRVTVVGYDLDGPPPPEIAARRFDTIVAVNVLEHVEKDADLVSTLSGLLKPGGKLVVYVPACPFAYGAIDRALGHFRRYTPETLTALLAVAGLEPQRPAYVNFFGLFGWTINGRLFRRDRLSPRQVAVFERLLPLLRLEDHLRLPIGVGLHTSARKAQG